MIAVIGGLLTALAWAIATLSSARASRTIGPTSTTAWICGLGLLLCLPLLALDQPAEPVAVGDIGLIVVVGAGYLLGMLFNYAALAGGAIGVAAPIASTEGAIAATLAILAGEPASPMLVALLLVVVTGIVVTTIEPGLTVRGLASGDRRFVLFAIGAAACFGVSLYAAGRASEAVPLSWVVSAGRVAGVIAVTLPLLLLGRLRFERSVLPFVSASAALEVVGYLTFAIGARENIAVTAVLASQFAVLAAIAAHRMGERLARQQWLGVGAVAVGVAAITAMRA